jgi:hypothetical protein
MNALECRTLTAECMTPYSMPMTIHVIYPQSHCVCLFNLLVSGVDKKLARGWLLNYNVQALQEG